MRISRKKRPKKPLIPHYRVNDKIDAPEVRIIDDEKGNLGVFPLAEAMKMAKEQELDLVEINPKAKPPIANIVDFSHFKYQKEKEARKQKANAHETELKGIRLSVRISDHDLEVRRKQAEKFLKRGDKVRLEVVLRGRENARASMAYDVINTFKELLEEEFPVRLEQDPTRQGNRVSAIIAKA